jgi:chromosome segregation protein
MRLSTIKLAGFKSFVEPTKIPFPDQMTCVVGPNGCGKSNVIDAVRWVLGESSAKNLRGDAMTDVIFNGSTNRKAISQASVELIFDNSLGEQELKNTFADRNQIAIKRLVTRDGQSLYFLNGSKCRKRDITDIFLGTGLGPRSYAIIEQGMISRLIESKPHELRVFLEEAAGVSKYKERRRETQTRIKSARENLERLLDVRKELQSQLDKLAVQSLHKRRNSHFSFAPERVQSGPTPDSRLRPIENLTRLELNQVRHPKCRPWSVLVIPATYSSHRRALGELLHDDAIEPLVAFSILHCVPYLSPISLLPTVLFVMVYDAKDLP